MKRHSTWRVIPVLLAAVLLSACRAAPSPTPTVEPPPVVEEVTKVVPIAGVVEPENIRLQLDWGGSMVTPFAWGDLPELTLLDDGTLIYREAQ